MHTPISRYSNTISIVLTRAIDRPSQKQKKPSKPNATPQSTAIEKSPCADRRLRVECRLPFPSEERLLPAP